MNPNKTKKSNIYTPVLYGKINGRLVKDRFHSLIILLNFGEIYSIVLGKHTKKLWNKNTKMIKWSTQGGELKTHYTDNVELVLP